MATSMSVSITASPPSRARLISTLLPTRTSQRPSSRRPPVSTATVRPVSTSHARPAASTQGRRDCRRADAQGAVGRRTLRGARGGEAGDEKGEGPGHAGTPSGLTVQLSSTLACRFSRGPPATRPSAPSSPDRPPAGPSVVWSSASPSGCWWDSAPAGTTGTTTGTARTPVRPGPAGACLGSDSEHRHPSVQRAQRLRVRFRPGQLHVLGDGRLDRSPRGRPHRSCGAQHDLDPVRGTAPAWGHPGVVRHRRQHLGGPKPCPARATFRLPPVECGTSEDPYAQSVEGFWVPAVCLAQNIHNDPEEALGPPNYGGNAVDQFTGFVSLGNGGWVDVDMEACAVDNDGRRRAGVPERGPARR